jgi:hypothetical protein
MAKSAFDAPRGNVFMMFTEEQERVREQAERVLTNHRMQQEAKEEPK